ncbi:MAG TPA: PilZ domain-containing protein [Desulfuromonadales bacterium]|nr:PilZ domain-containing protein [Desulfuromonadales bacterium]
MKCFLLADNRAELLATLEPILKHWGYRVLAATNARQVNDFLRQSYPCLLIIGADILGSPQLNPPPEMIAELKSGNLPLLALEQEGATEPAFTSLETLSVPLDILSLFAFIQHYVEKHPRQNLRLRVRIPGMYKTGENDYILADVYSLSIRGLFFKAAAKLEKGDTLSVVFPLLGHCKELEVRATVLYTVQPGNRNNYLQGFGVVFDSLSDAEKANLKTFIEERFLNEVSTCQAGVGDFCARQLKR